MCFTPEEAWDIIGGGEEDSVLFHTWHDFPQMPSESEAALSRKWQAVREVRNAVTAAIEPLRSDKSLGSSLQAEVVITAPAELAAALSALDGELRFALLVSKAEVKEGAELSVEVKVSGGEKCERCWHYTADVGTVAGHETVCARCAENVEGRAESRHYV